MGLDEVKAQLKRFWRFLGEDSILSWVVSIALAFVIIKYLVYPGLGLLLGTSFPIVAVVSESMEQPGSFDDWWAVHEDFYLQQQITKQQFREFPFSNGFNKGDIMILRGAPHERVARGDVLVFWSGKPYPIIHRVVKVDVHPQSGEIFYETKGDNNRDQVVDFYLDETRILPEQVVGKAVGRVPYLGYVRVWASDAMNLLLGREPVS